MSVYRVVQFSPQPSFRMAPSPEKISSAHWPLSLPKFCKISRCPAVKEGEGGSGRGKEFQEGRAQRHGWTWYIWGNASSSIRLEPRVCGDGLRGAIWGGQWGKFLEVSLEWHSGTRPWKALQFLLKN